MRACRCRWYAPRDLEVDEHHTIEDVAILGEAIYEALGSKRGIDRYGFCAADGREPRHGADRFRRPCRFRMGRCRSRASMWVMPTEMFSHFFKSLCTAMRCNLHEARGENNHHMIEGVFKGLRARLEDGRARDVFSGELPSSKGVL